MKLSVSYQPSMPASASPYRLCSGNGLELEWANAFLDGQRLRQLSLRSLRAYAYDLLDFARWFEPQRRPFAEITESTLVDYVRHQLEQDPKPTSQTVNHRLTVVHCGYRFHTGQDIPAGHVHFQRSYRTRSPLGYGRPRRAMASGLRLKQERRIIVPLSTQEVAKFWQSFRTFRDLALVGLMLLDGLRSCEVLELQLEDLQLVEGQMRVLGKGNKKRIVPLPPEILEVLGNYLRLERPRTNSPALFVSLKGPPRGERMTSAGLRSLFRHHRALSHVPQANPHRFRHTFGADMARAGMSLPALQCLMGHSQIHTVGSEEARSRRWPPSAAQTARTVFPYAAFTKTQASRDASEGINPTRLTSPYPPYSVALGSNFQPPFRHRLNRCDQIRRTIHRSSRLKSLRTWARL